jgi:hypothetical protein
MQEQQDRSAREATLARENADRDRAERAAREAADSARFTSELDTALNATRGAAQSRISSLGLDPNAYNDRIERELTLARTRVPTNAQGVGQFFNTDFVDTLLNEDRTARRQRATATAQRDLPTDFTTMFADTADDPFIDGLLGRQSAESRAALDRGRARGNITDTGYNAGLGRIDELSRAGRAQAQTLGDSIINRFRSDAGNVRNRALERAGSIDLFEPDFDLSPFSNELSGVQRRFSENLGGEIEGALAGQSFFDLGDVLNRAGIAQGAQNPSATAELSPAALLAERQRKEREQTQRGIGGGGTF